MSDLHQDFRSKLLQMAADDPAFRKRLQDDPRGVISELLGHPVLPEIEVVVVEDHLAVTITEVLKRAAD